MRAFILIIGSLLFSTALLASESYKGMWLGTFANKKLDNNLSVWLETQVRYNLDFGNTSQVLYRTGVLQKTKNKQALGYLYAYIQSSNSREHRLTLQHTNTYGAYTSFNFSHRARLESRHLEETTKSYENSMRARYLLRAEQNHHSIYNLVLWNEVFLNLNKTSWNGDQTFDRNRFFAGFKRSFFSSNRFEFGYLNQFVPRDSGDTIEHIATLYLFF